MKDILTIARIQIAVILLFILAKKWLRPIILQSDAPAIMDIIVLSLPNFFEGIIGVLSLTYIGLYLNHKIAKYLSHKLIYALATILSAVFVLTQEFKIHNIGGNNVYDPYDVLFSIIGLGTGYAMILYLRPVILD